MDPIDLRNIVTYFPPQSAYDVLRALCDQVGTRSVRDALIQIQADKIVEESHVQNDDPRPYNGTILTPPTLEDAVLRPIDKDAELWAINRELVQAGLKPWQYESFAACVAELRRRAKRPEEEIIAFLEYIESDIETGVQMNTEEWERMVKTVREWMKE